MKDVKAITIPEGAVKQIQDSNGNIIWGSQSAFPYRRLEYIHFSGTEYIDTAWISSNPSRYYKIEASITEYRAGRLLSSYDGTAANAARRFYLPEFNNNGMHACLGGTWGSYLWTAADVPLNTKLTVEGVWSKSTNNVLNWSVSGTGITTVSETITGTSTTLSPAQRYYLFATNDNGSPNYNYALIGNLYGAERRNTDSSGALNAKFIPCQRKSDNVCGVYDAINNLFRPMQGTNITTQAAGPVVDEYWDLTA